MAAADEAQRGVDGNGGQWRHLAPDAQQRAQSTFDVAPYLYYAVTVAGEELPGLGHLDSAPDH